MTNKKKIIIIISAVVLVAIITTGTILIVNSINKKDTSTVKVVPTQESANALRDQAEAARAKSDTASAEELLLEAQQQVSELPVTDESTNARVDIEAQLFLLEQAKKAATPEVQP